MPFKPRTGEPAKTGRSERRGKAERREQLRGDERGDLRDPPALDMKHVERERPELRFARRTQIVSGGRLGVRRGDQAAELPNSGSHPWAWAVMIASRPSYQVGIGGMVRRASSRSSSVSVPASAHSWASR